MDPKNPTTLEEAKAIIADLQATNAAQEGMIQAASAVIVSAREEIEHLHERAHYQGHALFVILAAIGEQVIPIDKFDADDDGLVLSFDRNGDLGTITVALVTEDEADRRRKACKLREAEEDAREAAAKLAALRAEDGAAPDGVNGGEKGEPEPDAPTPTPVPDAPAPEPEQPPVPAPAETAQA